MSRPTKKRLPQTRDYPEGTPRPALYRDELDIPTEETTRPAWTTRILNLLRAGQSKMGKPIGTPRSQPRDKALDSIGELDSLETGLVDHFGLTPPRRSESNAWVVGSGNGPNPLTGGFRNGVRIEEHNEH